MSNLVSVPERLLPDPAADDAKAAQLAAQIKVAVPGIIQSFDATHQTVVVQVGITENIRLGGVAQTVDLGTVADVPIVLARAGTFSLTMPIAAGDECLLVFADGCIDAWFQSGGTQARIDGRRHELADAIAIIGLWSQPRVLANYSTAAAQLRSDDGLTVVEVGAGEVTIKATTVTVHGTHVNVTGSANVTVSGSGNTTIEGRNFLTHTHSGVATGTGVTGPVI